MVGGAGVGFFCVWKSLVCHISQLCLVQFEIIKFCKTTPFNSLPTFPSVSEGISWPNVLTNDTHIESPLLLLSSSLSSPSKETAFDRLSLELGKHNRGDKLSFQVSSHQGGLPGHLNKHASLLSNQMLLKGGPLNQQSTYPASVLGFETGPPKSEQLQRNLMWRGKCKNPNKYHSLL